jgi:DNA polymerase III alpha subunit (gram-positive type)
LENKKPVYDSKSAIYISVDIECSGPVPIDYSMLSLGVCVVGNEDGDHDSDSQFYVEMKPISDKYVKEALEVCNFSLEELRIKGMPPQQAMKKFADWIAKVSGRRKPVFVAYPVTFDWSFVNYYFYKYIGLNPFGVSGINIKSVWIGKTNAKWHSIGIDDIKKSLCIEHLLHTHNALDDAKAQSILFKKMID